MKEGYLDGITGEYQTPQGYYVRDEVVDEFDKSFPPKEKLKLPGQIFRGYRRTADKADDSESYRGRADNQWILKVI